MPESWVQLAIETTGRLGSVAVLVGERVLRQTNLDPKLRSAATLAPAIAETLSWCRNNKSAPNFVAVADGPGSFTGLRIGITTAKTLGFALRLPVVGVDSAASIAAAAFASSPDCQAILVGMDAYRQQTFAGRFERAELLPPINEVPETWSPHPFSVSLLENSEWERTLSGRSEKTDIAGDTKPLGKFVHHQIDRQCDAVGVGLLGIRAAIRNEFIDPISLIPRYLKLSAAEEKAASEV